MNILLKLPVLFLLLGTASYAQEVSVTDSKGTIKTIRNSRVSVGTNAPNMPIESDIWINPSTSTTMIYSGTAWFQIGGGSSSSVPAVYTGSFTIPRTGGQTNRNYKFPIRNLPFVPSQITFVAHTNLENLSRNGSNTGGKNSNTIQNTAGTMHGFVRKNTPSHFTQNVIFIGTHGNSVNDITRFSSENYCIGLRYTNKDGQNLGIIRASLDSFDANGNNFGFTLSVDYLRGTQGSSNALNRDIFSEDVVVLFTAYK